jgi:2-deoxy-D-gluconate 3-dehydrogenase
LDLGLRDKVVVVTGGASGLGRAMVEGFADEGAKVVIADINMEAGEEVAKRLSAGGACVRALWLDVRYQESIDAMVEAVLREFGRIDVLCNNAGVNVRKQALDVTRIDWDTVMDVNLKGMFFTAQAVGRVMVRQGRGKIINTASVSAVLGHPERAIYASAKGGVLILTKVLANEWAKFGINVNAIGPGFVRTPLTEALIDTPGVEENMVARIPLGRVGRTADIVGAVLFLASCQADYITGQLLLIDGGRTVD